MIIWIFILNFIFEITWDKQLIDQEKRLEKWESY